MNKPLSIQTLSHGFDNGVWPWKKDKGQELCLRDINLELEPGSITGLLGKNGAGKTTLIQCALGLIKPNKGGAQVFNEPSWNSSPQCRQQIGYVPQKSGLLHNSSAHDLLKHWGSYYQQWDQSFAESILKKLDIDSHKTIHKLSVGQQQCVSIAMALAHRPSLLILDEPVAGLDPKARRQFIEILLEDYWDEEKTILFSSHITSDIERIASDVLFLKDQNILLQENLDQLKSNYHKITLPPIPDRQLIAGNIKHIVGTRERGDDLVITVSKKSENLPTDINQHSLNLEDLFMELHA